MVEYRLVIYNLSLFPVLKPEAKSPKGGAKNMAKISGKYETIFIVNPSLEEAAATAVVDKFKSLVEANGTNVEVEDWGKRRLAYPIEDQTEGVYTLIRFESKPEFPAELDRIYKITDGVMRSIIVSLDD